MNPDEYAQKLRLLARRLLENQKNDLLLVSKELRSLIVKRVQNEQERADGTSFEKYSNKKLPRSTYASKLPKSKRSRLKGKFASYEDFRRAGGFQTRAKDFTLSGQLFKDIQAEITLQEETKTIATIRPQTEQSRLKLAGNEKRSGKILEASEDEIQTIRKVRQDRINNLINELDI